MLGISTSNLMVGGYRKVIGANDIDPEAQAVYNRIIADGGVSNLTRLNYFVVGLKTIYGSLANVPVCYDAHWIGYKLGSGTGATSGQAAAKLYSLTVAGDAVQATLASQPLLLSHNGASTDNYWFSARDANNYIYSTTTYATSDFDIEFYIDLNTATNTQRIINGNASGNPYSFIFNAGTGTITIEYYTGGYKAATCSVAVTGANTWRISRNSTTGAITILKNGASQTVAGDQVAGALTSLPTELRLCNLSTATQGMEGKMYWAKFYISGVLTRYMNPATYSAATSQTQFTATTGEVWTINTGTAATGYKGVLVNRTIVQSDGIDDTMLSGTISVTTATNYLAVDLINLIGSQYFIASSVADVNIIYFSPTTVRFGNATAFSEVVFGTVTTNRLALFTAVKNGASSLTLYNNSNQQTGTVGSATITNIKLFAPSSSTSFFGNIKFNNFILSNLVDGSTVRTAMYNFIRGLNGNAF